MRLTDKIRERRLSRVMAYAAKGLTRREIVRHSRLSYYTVREIIKSNGIPVKSGYAERSRTRHPEMDALMTGEYSLTQIGEKCGHVTRQAVEQYFIRTGQLAAFNANRKAKKEHSETVKERYKADGTSFVVLLNRYLQNRLKDEPPYVQVVVEYDRKRLMNSRNIPAEKILRLLEACEKAESSKKVLTLEELAELSGIECITSVSGVLKRLGKKTPYDTLVRERKKQVVTPAAKKEAIARAYGTDVPIRDIAYFLGLPAYVVSVIMRTRFGNTGERTTYIAAFREANFLFNEVLNYRTASQIYDVHDGGMSRDEIVYCFDGKARKVDYALEHRSEIEPRITGLLDVLYPEVKHDKPYLRP